MRVLCEKTAFVMQNFQNLGASGGGADPFLTKPPKGTSLADFTRFEPLCVQIRSGVFPLDEPTKKRDTTKSHRDIIFHLFAGNSPTQPNLTPQSMMNVVVTKSISTSGPEL